MITDASQQGSRDFLLTLLPPSFFSLCWSRRHPKPVILHHKLSAVRCHFGIELIIHTFLLILKCRLATKLGCDPSRIPGLEPLHSPACVLSKESRGRMELQWGTVSWNINLMFIVSVQRVVVIERKKTPLNLNGSKHINLIQTGTSVRNRSWRELEFGLGKKSQWKYLRCRDRYMFHCTPC